MIPAATDKNIEGEVTAVAGGSDEQTGSFTAIIAWKNELGDKIKSGMSAQIRINIKPDEEHIIIPLFSIINKDDGDYVFTAVENKAVLNRITSNNSFGERIEVADGLSEGDLIIITRISTINPGEPVKVRIVGKSGEWQ